MSRVEVLIVGAGLAGLCCGRRLAECGIPFSILEASNGIGGRVRTDRVDGFQLDRGFQVYLTEYPEGKRILDLAALDLKPFTRGVLVWHGDKFHRLADPRIEPLYGLKGFVNPIGSSRDKLRMIRLFCEIDRGTLDEQIASDERLSLDFLRWNGRFTPEMIDQFLRPLFAGISLDPTLATSSRFFRFVFRMFASGSAAVPAAGMQAVPDQISAKLPAGSIRLGAEVAHVGDREVTLVDGESIRTRAVVVAAEGHRAATLLGEIADPGSNGSVTIYYSADRAPIDEPIVMLNGEGRQAGLVNHVAIVSNTAPAYAPPGKALIAASIVGLPNEDDEELDRLARIQLAGWFGQDALSWRHLMTYRIPHSLPNQSAGALDPWQRPVRLRPGLYVCGDHRDNGSIDGAMTSGFRAAQAVMEDLHKKRV